MYGCMYVCAERASRFSPLSVSYRTCRTRATGVKVGAVSVAISSIDSSKRNAAGFVQLGVWLLRPALILLALYLGIMLLGSGWLNSSRSSRSGLKPFAELQRTATNATLPVTYLSQGLIRHVVPHGVLPSPPFVHPSRRSFARLAMSRRGVPDRVERASDS